MHVLRMNTWDCYDEGAKLNRIDKSSIVSFKKLDFQVLTSTKITEKRLINFVDQICRLK